MSGNEEYEMTVDWVRDDPVGAVERISKLREITAAFLDAVTGDENPQLWRLAWLETLLDEICESQFIESHDDPSSAGDMVRECRDLARMLRAACEKARGT